VTVPPTGSVVGRKGSMEPLFAEAVERLVLDQEGNEVLGPFAGLSCERSQ